MFRLIFNYLHIAKLIEKFIIKQYKNVFFFYNANNIDSIFYFVRYILSTCVKFN